MTSTIKLFVLILFIPCLAWGAVLYDETLDGYADKAAAEAGVWHGTDHDRITLESGSAAYGGSGKCWRIDWSTGGTIALQLPLTSFNKSALYVRFYYKHTGERNANSKLLKMHGVRADTSYSNFTVTGAYGGGFTAMICGPGTGVTNDGQCLYTYTSTTGGCIGIGTVVNHALSELSNTVFDGNWHCLEFYFKYNTNTGSTLNNDGEFALWVDSADGTPSYRVTGINMRHPDNSMYFASASFGDHAQTHLGFYDWFDNIVISDSYVGPEEEDPPVSGARSTASGTAGWR